jgi:hypothetical protein
MILELDALETSFDLLAPRGEQLMDIFYARRFAVVPAVKPLFACTDFQRRRLISWGARAPAPVAARP